MSERITNNVNPTHADVRAWGYDEDLHFIEQDEELLLYGLYYVPVLLELAQDPACPKRNCVISILGQFAREAALYQNADNLRGLEQILNSTRSSDARVMEWLNYLSRVLACQQHPFPVDEHKAWIMARDLLLGIGRIGDIKMEKEKQDSAWCFSLSTSIREYLLIDKQTGVYTYRRI